MNIKRRPAPIGRRRRGRSFKTGRPPGRERGRGGGAPPGKVWRGGACGGAPASLARHVGAGRGAPQPGAGGPGGGPAGRRDAAAPEEVAGSPPGSRCCVRVVARSRQGPVPMSVGLLAGPGTAVRDGKGAESKI